MTKEKLKRLKSSILTLIMCLSLSGCSKEKKETNTVESIYHAIFFVEGKAFICPKGYDIYMDQYNSKLEKTTKLITMSDMILSSGVEVIKMKNLEDAINFAEEVVGEENIIYLNIEEDNITFEKTLK